MYACAPHFICRTDPMTINGLVVGVRPAERSIRSYGIHCARFFALCRTLSVRDRYRPCHSTLRRAASMRGAIHDAIQIRQHFFDDGPVPQPRGRQRVADLTGLKTWHSASPMLGHMEQEVLPRLHAGLPAPRPLRVLELGSGCVRSRKRLIETALHSVAKAAAARSCDAVPGKVWRA